MVHISVVCAACLRHLAARRKALNKVPRVTFTKESAKELS